MKKNLFLSILITIFLSSCGGGGSSPDFILNVQNLSTLNIDEDNSLETTITVSTDTPASLIYSITKDPNNGIATIDNFGNLFYEPNLNYFGVDTLRVTIQATSNSTGSTIRKNLSLNININPVNDQPTINITDNIYQYNSNTLISDDVLSFNATIKDVDNDLSELTVFAEIDGDSLSATFNESTSNDGSGLIDINVSSISEAGLKSLNICISDGALHSCGASIQSYFISNKQIKSIEFCDNSGLNCSTSDQYLYYIVGGPNTNAKTNYLFIGDQLNGTSDKEDFHEALLTSINQLYSSDAQDFIDGFFNIIVLEEINLSGVSIFDIRTGCYSWDTNIYCIGEVDRDLMSEILPDWTIASFLTTEWGRGVAQGSTNIQPISSSSKDVVMHELGHSHGFMGDEYDSGGERTFDEWYGDWGINTTTVSDPNLVKWKHLIDFDYEMGVPGIDYDLCENYIDGSIHYRNGGINYEDCECFFYQYPQSDFTGYNEDDSCKEKVGIFEGTYYGEIGDFRGNWRTIMWWGVREYGPINIDGFAIGSIMNQGFRDFSINGIRGSDYLLEASSLNESISFSIDAIFDESKLKLKWLIDGVEYPEYENKTSVTFQRPISNDWVSYSYIIEDLSNNLYAINDPLLAYDFYEGNFERAYYYEPDISLTPIPSQMPWIGSFEWYDPNIGYRYDDDINSSNIDNFFFAISCCSMGATFKINWDKYGQSSSQKNELINENKIFKRASPDVLEKNINMYLSKNELLINSIELKKPNPSLIKDPLLRKNDIYGLEFYDRKDNLIYVLGIGDPFRIRVQHIGIDDDRHFNNEVPIENFSIVIPNNINPSSIRLVKRNEKNIYNTITTFYIYPNEIY